jgi:inner membrane protein
LFSGASVEKLDIPRDLPWLDRGSQQARDVERFRWFSNGYVASDPRYPNRVMDIRYSLIPNELAPLWSIELRPGARFDEHADYLVHRDTGDNRAALLWRMLSGG